VGGSNPSLIEMMFYEKPIIAYNCMFNKCTLNNNGTFFRNIDDLVEKMEIFYSDHTNEMIKRSKNAKTYALQNYTWKRISNDYSRVFLKFK
jgi:glycosyltransferase involved in cell wall biosynthesis